MGLLEFFAPDYAAATHLKAMREQNERARYTRRSDAAAAKAHTGALKLRIDDLEDDLGFLTLLLTGLLSGLCEKGTLTREDVLKELEELDATDGAADGQLDIQMLRTFLSQKPAGPSA